MLTNDHTLRYQFTEVADGTFRALVTGLREGRTQFVAVVPGAGASGAAAASTTTRSTGPVFSGAHQTPFYCETEAAGLGPATDDDCSAPTQVVYRYRTTDGRVRRRSPTRRAGPPTWRRPSVGGATRAVHRPPRARRDRPRASTRSPPSTTAPRPSPCRAETGWNGKVVMTFGGGCNVGYHQGNATAGVLNADALSRGYAVVSNSLLVNETNCNPVLAAEAAMMTKERLIEVYGPVTHTIGLGGSGGAIMQYTITHAYPGILDGLLPSISYADAVSNAGPPDCALLLRYLTTPPGATLTAGATPGHRRPPSRSACATPGSPRSPIASTRLAAVRPSCPRRRGTTR